LTKGNITILSPPLHGQWMRPTLTPSNMFPWTNESQPHPRTASRSLHPFLQGSPVCLRHIHRDHATCAICHNDAMRPKNGKEIKRTEIPWKTEVAVVQMVWIWMSHVKNPQTT